MTRSVLLSGHLFCLKSTTTPNCSFPDLPSPLPEQKLTLFFPFTGCISRKVGKLSQVFSSLNSAFHFLPVHTLLLATLASPLSLFFFLI